MYRLTLQDLRNWYNTFNKQYFNGELKTPILGISHTRRALGDFGGFGNLPRIRISTYFQRTKHSFQETLLHEMIHLWQWQFKMVDKNHGFDFKRKAREINKDGWDFLSKKRKVLKNIKIYTKIINFFIFNDIYI